MIETKHKKKQYKKPGFKKKALITQLTSRSKYLGLEQMLLAGTWDDFY